MPTENTTPALLWLLIGIPTIPRPTGGADYLGRSLSTVLEALPASDADPLHGRVGCLVLNNRPGAHAEFARLRGEYEGLHDSHPPTRAFSFEERDAAEVTAELALKNTTSRFEQHTRDVVALVRRAHGRARLFLFMEDDVRLCPLALLALQRVAAEAARRDPEWLSVRLSFGLHGVLLRGDNGDLPALAAHLAAHGAAHPPDHLTTLFMLGGAPDHLPPRADDAADGGVALGGDLRLGGGWRRWRQHFAYRFNLMENFGTVSTLRDAAQSDGLANLKCNDFLGVPALFIEECFHLAHCPDDELWPCPAAAIGADGKAEPSALIRWAEEVVRTREATTFRLPPA